MNALTIESVKVASDRHPTQRPECDGTLCWDSTTMVHVEVTAGEQTGWGYTYSDAAAAKLIDGKMKPLLLGGDPMSVRNHFQAMVKEIRNLGRPGIASTAISAIDIALWDLKAKLLGVPLVDLLGRVRENVPVYGSGGFTSYTDNELIEQMSRWVKGGINRVKMKVGRNPPEDLRRVGVVRDAIGDADLYVDANGAYDRKQAIQFAVEFSKLGVTWFEEPVSSDDLVGLRLNRDANIPGMEITAGEYGYHNDYFLRMLSAGAVDVLQADATRCGGVTGFLQVATLAEAFHVPLSSHCAPALHAHLGCVVPGLRHIEYFHDHVQIERGILGGFREPEHGMIRPPQDHSGFGWCRINLSSS
ncbi:MAG: enolase C-terminal domain-like protein [Pirellulaceae bacterium]